MKRSICFLLLIFSFWGLYGCQQKQLRCRYVTQVDIHCDHRGTPIHRTYTTQDKMGAVLMYLRLLDTTSPAELDPEATAADAYQIRVALSDGSSRDYMQKGHRYLFDPITGWHNIPAAQATKLYSLMQYFESDIS